MKIAKEIGFRCFVLLVMLSLAFVAYDMSMPVLQSENEVHLKDVVESIVQPFKAVFDEESAAAADLPNKDYDFTLNILLPLVVYMASIGGFMYLLIEDFKLLRTFSHQNKLARYIWTIWIVILIGLMLIPIFFGLQLVMKGLVLAVIVTGILLILLAILFRMSYKAKK